MIYAVVGNRWFDEYLYVRTILDRYMSKDMKIVTGDANGADACARKYAVDRLVGLQVHEADWDKHGRAAGPIRNELIVRDCDEVIAFWDGKSRGTKSTINLAHKAGKPVHIYWITAPEKKPPQRQRRGIANNIVDEQLQNGISNEQVEE
jgi:hypothetical protein